MKKNAKKNPQPHLLLASEEAMVGALNHYVESRLKLEKRAIKLAEKIAALNTEFDEENQEDRNLLGSLETSLQLFAVSHRTELFAEPKSRTYPNGTLGFSINPPSVDRIVEKEKWDTIAERLEQLPWGEPYVREGKVSVDKEALLRDRKIIPAEQLAEAGLVIGQSEVFFITPSANAVERCAKEIGEVAA